MRWTSGFRRGILLAAAVGLALVAALSFTPGAGRTDDEENRAGPDPPTLADTDPDSPANDNSPHVSGAAEADSTVRLYTTADCSGEAVAIGSDATFASPGLTLDVPDDSRTTFRATATDGDGDVSDCSSSSIAYVEDSTSPAPPRLSASDPHTPANENSPRIKGAAGAKPWFLYLTPSAPHSPYVPEPRYLDAPVPSFVPNPAFFEGDRSDKPPAVRAAIGDPAAIREVRIAQLRMLKSVDDLVARVFSTLDAVGESDETLAFFLSDNGFMWGDHGLGGKHRPYTASAKIPFFMRWPAKVAGGDDDERLVANVDLAATIAEAAGLDPDPEMDGMSLFEDGSRERILLELLGREGVPPWASLRTHTYQYTEWYGGDELTPGDEPVFREYYDLEADPWQLTNYLGDADPANDPSPETIDALHRELETDLACAGRGGLPDRPACAPASSTGPGQAGQARPNVLLIVTDDQRATETLDVMPRTRELFDDQGTSFPNAFATTPLCCPSRASILTGRYAHNHRVTMNSQGPLLDQGTTIERRLREAGYRTGIYGKFLNPPWRLADNPPHFDQWSLVPNGHYTDFKANEQGRIKTIAEYATTYLADKATEFIRQQADDGDATVRLYEAPTTADCSAENLVASGSAAELDSPGLRVSVPDDATTTFRATATDLAGNTSGCSSSLVEYVEDSSSPSAPALTDTDPDSPANDTTPRVKGTVEAGSTVRLSTSADCTGDAIATGSARELAFPGLEASVPDDSITTFRAAATDAAGNVSECSPDPIVYVEDSIEQLEDQTAPTAPALTGTDPAPPANHTTPRVSGTAEPDSAVRLYKSADCSGPAVGIASAEELASPGVEVQVPNQSTTAFRATATDQAGNASECSPNPIVYVEDSTPPQPPQLMGTDPRSPSNTNAPLVKGTASSDATVKVYRAATTMSCTAASFAASGSADEFASPGLPFSVDDDSTTILRARATDRAGNTSKCSQSSIAYSEDSTAPPAPVVSAADPASPANNNFPRVHGTAEVGSTVRLYKASTSADCTPAKRAASGTAAAFASPGLALSVPNNSTTRVRATATDRAGNTSPCSATSVVYTEDSTPPAAPAPKATDPASPANDNAPRVKGTAAASTTVRLYIAPTRTGCTATNLLAAGSAADFATAGLPIAVPDDSANRVRATAADSAGNTSPCSEASVVYTEDSTPPAAPVPSGTDPNSPANHNSPKVKGAAEGGSTVRLYKAPNTTDCVPPRLAATGPAGDFAAPGLTISVADNSTTRIRALAVDVAGNPSTCSPSSVVYRENSSLAPSLARASLAGPPVSALRALRG